MLSTPTAKPISIVPAMISLAIVVTAIRPLEQNLFTTCTLAVSGIPAVKAAARAWYIASGVKTVPTQISSISFGSIFECATECCGEKLQLKSLIVGNTTRLKHLKHELVRPATRLR